MSELSEVVLWMEKGAHGEIAQNKVMLCTRNMFLLENMRDPLLDEYTAILKDSGNARIIQL